MSENPYAPPTAEVADIRHEEVSLKRPQLVTIGIWLLWLDLLVSIPQPLIQFFNTPASQQVAGVHYVKLVIVLATIGLLALFTYKAGQGRNWARICHFVLMILGVVGTVISYVMLRRMFPEKGLQPFDFESPLEAGIFLANNLLSIAAVRMLFTPAANDWYRAIRSPWR